MSFAIKHLCSHRETDVALTISRFYGFFRAIRGQKTDLIEMVEQSTRLLCAMRDRYDASKYFYSLSTVLQTPARWTASRWLCVSTSDALQEQL